MSISRSQLVVLTYSYDSATLDSLTLANGVKTTYGYDSLLRLKELTNSIPSLRAERGNPGQNTILNQLTFSYDQNSNILGNGHDVYLYDSLNRLTQTNYEPLQDKKNITESFNYDPMGSRLSSLVIQTYNGWLILEICFIDIMGVELDFLMNILKVRR